MHKFSFQWIIKKVLGWGFVGYTLSYFFFFFQKNTTLIFHENVNQVHIFTITYHYVLINSWIHRPSMWTYRSEICKDALFGFFEKRKSVIVQYFIFYSVLTKLE